MKKFFKIFLILGFLVNTSWALPKKIKIFLAGFGQQAYLGGHFGGTSEYDFSGCNDTVQSFKEALWTKITEKFNSPEITAHKVFSDDERNLMKKASDYFAEFCHAAHQGEGWYAKNMDLEGVPLQSSYVKKDGWYSVDFRKRKPAPFEKDLSHTWDLCLTGF